FFQAEDGIRDFHVTGVQTCALPILLDAHQALLKDRSARVSQLLRLAELSRTGVRDQAAARHYLEEALQLEPGHSLAAFELARLQIGRAACRETVCDRG